MATPEDSDELKEAIRSVGLRATPARVATLRLLRGSSSPLTHAEVAAELSESGVDKTTAFRNLVDMAEAGLLRRAELGDHVYRFEEIRCHERGCDPHPHFLCVSCGTVTCLDTVRLTAGSLKASEEVGQVSEILLRGLCRNCQ